MDNETEVSVGDILYVPFWVLLPFLDVTPPDPFVRVVVKSKKQSSGVSPDGPIEILCCDLECPKGMIAYNIPVSYLIKPDDLDQWATMIGDWFRNFPQKVRDE